MDRSVDPRGRTDPARSGALRRLRGRDPRV